MTLLAWSAAVTLFVTRPDRAQNRWLALSLLPEPFLFVWGSAFMVFTDDPNTAYALARTSQAAVPIMIFATLRFLATLDTRLVSWLRSRTGMFLSAAFPLAQGIGFWVLPAGVESVARSGPFTWSITFGPLFNLVNLPSLLLFIYGLAAAVFAWRRARPGTATRDRAGIFALAFGLHSLGVFLLVAWVLFLAEGAPSGDQPLVWFLFPVPSLVFLLLLSYGVLKHQLFDIDLKVRWTLRRVSPVALLAGVFFVVKESIEMLLPGEGPVAELIGAASVGALFLPAWMVVGRLVERWMPGTPAPYRLVRRQRVYAVALEEALADGVLSSKDRNVLAALASQLDLSAKQTSRLEAEMGRQA